MGKKYKKPADETAAIDSTPEINRQFYFGKKNFRLMLIGLALIVGGFLLMMGPDANTVDGKFDPNSWNPEVFSIRRIRIAPLLVMAGFAVEAFAILRKDN